MKRNIIIVSLVFTLITGCSGYRPGISKYQYPEATEELPKGEAYLGISYKFIDELPETKATKNVSSAILITWIVPKGPAGEAGLKKGDIIIGFHSYLFDIPKNQLEKKFFDILHACQPGDDINVNILRHEISTKVNLDGKKIKKQKRYYDLPQLIIDAPEESKVKTVTKKEWVVLNVTVLLGDIEIVQLPPLQPIEKTDLGALVFSENVHLLNRWEKPAENFIDQYGIVEPYQNLRKRLENIESGDDGFRTQMIATAHREPFLLAPVGQYVTDRILKSPRISTGNAFADPDIHLLLLANHVSMENKYFTPVPADASPSEFQAWFCGHISSLSEVLEVAYSDLSEDERAHLSGHLYELTHTFVRLFYIHSQGNTDQFERNLKTISIGKKINMTALIQAAALTCKFILDTEDSVFAWMEIHPDQHNIETPWGKIGLGTRDHDRWDKTDVKFIYDPAGDDFYANGTGAATSFDQPISYIVDRSGDDAYQSTVNGAQGSGILGVGILIDRDGDDIYIGGRWAQGTGYLGMGLLFDAKGNDIYRATEFSQGAGLFGVGILSDMEGDDKYHAPVFSQGVGFTKGLGLLYDYSGDDEAFCSGSIPSSYGTPGIFRGWSQGCGVGFRYFASGGIGMVLDAGGRDRWEAGNFSQGGGYYYGLGIFRAGGDDDDMYIGSRYAQGFSAHQAAGLFIEDGGNDHYSTRYSVVSGLAWDECVSVFIDEKGNDTYEGGEFFSLGASAHSSISLFIDKSGEDIYRYHKGPAIAGEPDREGVTSFSLFMDLGEEIDHYTNERVGNNMERCWPQYGIFYDGDEESIHGPWKE